MISTKETQELEIKIKAVHEHLYKQCDDIMSTLMLSFIKDDVEKIKRNADKLLFLRLSLKQDLGKLK